MSERWLTSHDIARLLSYGDLRAARERMKELGAVKIGGQYRLHPDLLARLNGLERIKSGAATDQQHPQPSTGPSGRVLDQRMTTEPLKPGWWRDNG